MEDTTTSTTSASAGDIDVPVQFQHPTASLESSIFHNSSARKILVAEDGSPSSLNALTYTLTNLLQPTDILIILRVLSDDDCYAIYQIDNDDPENSLKKAMQKLAEYLLKSYTSLMDKMDLKGVTVLTDVKVGNAKNVICELAKDMNAQMVVMGKRGLGPVRRLVMGSVSDYVVRHAECPVLVVPKPE
ncbi:hypothetical protein BC829DRAFT_434025 [Chytridium lagenaria]|nr:hypothetical protein BC829DRAFT_434025 [Chytridium lagenaria]